MSQISLKSISGITSITTPAGADNQFTIHTNNTSEVIKLDHAGNIHINNHVNATGISSAASIDVGSNIKLGNAGIITATGISGGTFSGSTATFSGDVSITDKIVHTDDTNTAIRFPAADTVSIETAGNENFRVTSDRKVGINRTSPTRHLHVYSPGAGFPAKFESAYSYSSVEFADTGTVVVPYIGSKNDHLVAGIGNTERFRIGSAGQIGIAGANYGSSGQVLTSQGSGSAVTWATPSSGGAVLQVKSTTRTNQIDVSVNIDVDYGSFGDIVAVTITPTSSSNKIMIMYTISGSGDQGAHGVSTIKRAISGGSTSYPALGDSASGFHRASTGTRFIGGNNYNISTQSFHFLDSPSTTSAITYTIVGATEGANTWHINSNGENSSGHSWSARFCTTVTAMEVTP